MNYLVFQKKTKKLVKGDDSNVLEMVKRKPPHY